LILLFFRPSVASGGTLATFFTTFGDYKMKDLAKAAEPHYLSLSPPSKVEPTPLLQRLFGSHFIPHLGTVTTAFSAGVDVPIVHRSSSLMPGLYGPNFRFQEFAKVRNAFFGVVIHLALVAIGIAVAIPPLRWLAQKLAYAPGEGMPKERTAKGRVEFRGIAIADQEAAENKAGKAFGKLTCDMGPYEMTGLCVAEAAMVLLDQKRVPTKGEGGIFTPAFLNRAYIDRLEKVGVKIETNVLQN
jgi:short subunit dehydrogenase-like uncharacterized protein